MPYNEISILFVEDNPQIHAEILAFLKTKKFKNIYLAHNGDEGLRQYYQHKPDLVLTDLTMPIMDGLEMSEVMKQNPLDIPIILITSHFLKEITEKAIDIGIDGYLFKPLSLERLDILLEKLTSKILSKRDFKTEQKLLEEYKNALDMSAAVTKTDTDGVVTYVNDRFCEMTGYSKEELLGKTHRIIKHPDTPELVHKNIWSTLGEQKVWQGHIQNINKHGEAYHENTVIVPILDDNNETLEFIAVRQDITKLYLHEEFLKKRIEEEVLKNTALRRKQEEENLMEAKFATIGKIAAGITHEINTPLTYVRGNLELMIDDINRLDDAIKQKKHLIEDSQTLLDGVNRIASIVESMREMASQASEVSKPHNLYASLITALILTHNKAKHIAPIFLQEELFTLGMSKEKYHFCATIQSQRIEQVFVIIINNALDALKHIDNYDNRSIK
ncbi:MAG: response regulator [Sulfurimonadaceae bacterium]|jgi:PAS domain S-box-containing protein|nr:response regulator [Sulfurimonadaceae bacterium]